MNDLKEGYEWDDDDSAEPSYSLYVQLDLQTASSGSILKDWFEWVSVDEDSPKIGAPLGRFSTLKRYLTLEQSLGAPIHILMM
jgi:hypothetical protein